MKKKPYLLVHDKKDDEILIVSNVINIDKELYNSTVERIYKNSSYGWQIGKFYIFEPKCIIAKGSSIESLHEQAMLEIL